MDENRRAELFTRLVGIVATLRSPEGCPWDRAQTPLTIAPYLLEETHEVLQAIEEGDEEALRDELGDLMLEVALLTRMAEERGAFDIGDSLQAICEKLVRRHPHVFGEEAGKGIDADGVSRRWTEIKAAEKPDRPALGGVPRSLPALHRAKRVSEKAAGVGFDWPGALEVLDKVEEECRELREALAEKDRDGAAGELGDLLFALVNLGRHLNVDAEWSLHQTTDKFERRFGHVEKRIGERGKNLREATLEEMEDLWNEAKKLGV